MSSLRADLAALRAKVAAMTPAGWTWVGTSPASTARIRSIATLSSMPWSGSVSADDLRDPLQEAMKAGRVMSR